MALKKYKDGADLAGIVLAQVDLSKQSHYQYGQSASPWSPDGRHLVFSGELGYRQESTALPERGDDAVFAADVEGDDPPTKVGQGSLGVWSPQ